MNRALSDIKRRLCPIHRIKILCILWPWLKISRRPKVDRHVKEPKMYKNVQKFEKIKSNFIRSVQGSLFTLIFCSIRHEQVYSQPAISRFEVSRLAIGPTDLSSMKYFGIDLLILIDKGSSRNLCAPEFCRIDPESTKVVSTNQLNPLNYEKVRTYNGCSSHRKWLKFLTLRLSNSNRTLGLEMTFLKQ